MTRSANSIFHTLQTPTKYVMIISAGKKAKLPMKKRIIASAIFGFVYFFIVLTAFAFA